MTIQQSPYLRDQRFFPKDSLTSLSVTCDRMYIDVAQKVNDRTIGIYAKDVDAVTGEGWYLTATKQQTLRMVYTFTSTASITHNLPFDDIDYMTRMYGNFTDGTNWYGLPASANVAIAGQITFYVTSTQIVFLTGGGAPALTKGVIVIEWLPNI